MNIHINYGFGDSFRDVTTIYENTALPMNKPISITLDSPILVPAGQTLSIDDEAVSTGMDGAWGWFACPRLVTGEHEFVLSGDGDVSRTMEFVVPGIVINMR